MKYWGFSATHGQMVRHGWDYYYGYLDHQRAHGFYPPFLFENGKLIDIPGNLQSAVPIGSFTTFGICKIIKGVI